MVFKDGNGNVIGSLEFTKEEMEKFNEPGFQECVKVAIEKISMQSTPKPEEKKEEEKKEKPKVDPNEKCKGADAITMIAAIADTFAQTVRFGAAEFREYYDKYYANKKKPATATESEKKPEETETETTEKARVSISASSEEN